MICSQTNKQTNKQTTLLAFNCQDFFLEKRLVFKEVPENFEKYNKNESNKLFIDTYENMLTSTEKNLTTLKDKVEALQKKLGFKDKDVDGKAGRNTIARAVNLWGGGDNNLGTGFSNDLFLKKYGDKLSDSYKNLSKKNKVIKLQKLLKFNKKDQDGKAGSFTYKVADDKWGQKSEVIKSNEAKLDAKTLKSFYALLKKDKIIQNIILKNENLNNRDNIKKIQKHFGITETGILGPITKNAINVFLGEAKDKRWIKAINEKSYEKDPAKYNKGWGII